MFYFCQHHFKVFVSMCVNVCCVVRDVYVCGGVWWVKLIVSTKSILLFTIHLFYFLFPVLLCVCWYVLHVRSTTASWSYTRHVSALNCYSNDKQLCFQNFIYFTFFNWKNNLFKIIFVIEYNQHQHQRSIYYSIVLYKYSILKYNKIFFKVNLIQCKPIEMNPNLVKVLVEL